MNINPCEAPSLTPQRELLDAARLPPLSAPTLRRLFDAECELRRLPHCAEAQARFIPNQLHGCARHYAPDQLALEHYLSDEIERIDGSDADREDHRSAVESELMRHLWPAYLVLCHDARPGAFADFTLLLASTLHGRSVGFRSDGMLIRNRTNAAHAIALPAARPSREQLGRIGALLLGPPGAIGPIGQATWRYVLFLNAHPLADGNGRVARLLFNFDLARAGMSMASYLPIYSAMRHSRGGYEIRLREAEIFGRWNPIMRFMSQVIRIAATPIGARP